MASSGCHPKAALASLDIGNLNAARGWRFVDRSQTQDASLALPHRQCAAGLWGGGGRGAVQGRAPRRTEGACAMTEKGKKKKKVEGRSQLYIVTEKVEFKITLMFYYIYKCACTLQKQQFY
jgi:hypothetical protein